MASKTIPFVDFYSSHGIIPTRQNISNFEQHLQRRLALYRHLGLPAGTFCGASVLELGPGSGHNAVVTGMLKPSRYLLVDGNDASLESTKKNLNRYCPRLNFKLRRALIPEFRSAEKFDLVLCEGVIPTQKNPAAFLRHVASFVRPGGVVVFTCMDAISVLPEMLRRWLAWDLVKSIPEFQEKVARLTAFFHLDIQALPGMSRLPEDWVIDQLLHPWVGAPFAIPEAIRAIGNRGAVLGTSPRFLMDWRWYKNIVDTQVTNNSFGIDSYYSLGLNLIDFRAQIPQTNRAAVQQVESLSLRVYNGVFARERGQRAFSRKQLLPVLVALKESVGEQSPITGDSLGSFITYLRSDMTQEKNLAKFRSWWGRGQQYMSCVIK